jgi:DNA-binding CsgD family transcriptional regulator
VPRGRQSAEPLWRAIAVFRFAGLGYAVLLTVINRADYARLGWAGLGWAWVVIAVMAAWTVATTMAYARPERRTRLLKSAARPEFLDAVRRTAGGDAVFTPGLAALVLGEFRRLALGAGRDDADMPRLTEPETEILRMVATGMSYKQIATRLVLSHRTVQNHVQNTLGKLQLHNRVELVRYAIEHGLTGEPEA